jgi:hypothetical protein
LIGLGGLIGVGVVIVDEILRATRRGSMPPLAVGMGMYLPIALTTLIPIGAFIGWTYNKWAARQRDPAFAERMGVLMATGLIVGESLFGVAFAAIVGASGNDSPMALIEGNPWAVSLGLLLFAGAITMLYAKTRRDVRTSPVIHQDDALPPTQAAPR